MSALGHKRTCALQQVMSAFTPDSDRESGFPRKVMSALTPKADMCGALVHVRYGPKADIEPYSITSSARASSDGGKVRPSDFAVLRLMTSSNLIGCSTGISAGGVPLT